MTTNAVAWNKLQEEKRHNEEMERQGIESQRIARENIQLGYANVGLGYSQLAESARHNVTAERETQRHNEWQEYWQGENLSYQKEVNTAEGTTYWVNKGADLLGDLFRPGVLKEVTNLVDAIKF